MDPDPDLDPEHYRYGYYRYSVCIGFSENLLCGFDFSSVRRGILSFFSCSPRPTVLACIAERAFLRVLEGGCSVPVAVTSEVLPACIRLAGGVWSLDGSRHIGAVQLQDFPVIIASSSNENGHEGTNDVAASYATIAASNLMTAELVAAEQCGKALAHQLIGEGAEAILKEARAQNDKK